MHVSPSRAPVRSLASILPGETLRIEHILFDAIRARCREAGVRERDVVLCSHATSAAIWLETERSETLVLDRAVAQFVQAAPVRTSEAVRAAAADIRPRDRARPVRELERPL